MFVPLNDELEDEIKPRVLVSRCIEFAACRWNGEMIESDTVRRMKPYVEFIDVCPEADIGLGIPRPPIRLIDDGERLRVVQPTTGLEVTDRLETYTEDTLTSVGPLDGAILKGGSPSCGLKRTKVYTSAEKGHLLRTGAGVFGAGVLERFPNIAIETEERLRNCSLKNHFLTKLYTLARFRQTRQIGTLPALIEFHTRNKALFMAYHQEALRAMGRVVVKANHERRPEVAVYQAYDAQLQRALARGPRPGPVTNALMHLFGHYSQQLETEERAFFLESLEAYRNERIPPIACTQLLKSFGIRFGDEYVKEQTLFSPYPPELFDQCELGVGGREYWK